MDQSCEELVDCRNLGPKHEPKNWMYVAWLIVIFVIVIIALHTLRPECLLEDCACEDKDECEHCELHPMLAVWASLILAFLVVMIMWCIINL